MNNPIITHKILQASYKNLGGNLYPSMLTDEAVRALDAVLRVRSYVRVCIVYADGHLHKGWLCVNQSSGRVGLSNQKGAKTAIMPLLERGDIASIRIDTGDVVYSTAK